MVSPTCETYTTLAGEEGVIVGTPVIVSTVGANATGVMVGAAENVGTAEGANEGICDGAPVGTSTNGASTIAAGMVATKLVLTALSVVGFAKRVSIAADDTVGE